MRARRPSRSTRGRGTGSPWRSWLAGRLARHPLPLSGRLIELAPSFAWPSFSPWEPTDPSPCQPPSGWAAPSTPSAGHISLRELLGHSRVLLTGAEGVGKSHVCRWVAWHLCQRAGSPLPVLLRGRDSGPGLFVEGEDLAGLVGRWLSRVTGLAPAAREEAVQAVRSGQVWLLVDGVDELPLPERVELAARLANSPPSHLWVSARSARDLPSLPGEGARVQLAPLDPLGQLRMASSVLGEGAPRFLTWVEELPELEGLLTHPQHLLLLLEAFSERGEPETFKRRATLFRRLIELCLDRLPRAHGHPRARVRRFLELLADDLQKRGASTFDLDQAQALRDESELSGDVGTLLCDLGLFDGSLRGAMWFLHPSFVHVLVAEPLLSRPERLLELCERAPERPREEEILLLAAGLCADPDVTPHPDLTVERMLEALRRPPDTVVHTRKLLSGRMLRELGSVVGLSEPLRQWRRRIDVELSALLRDEHNLLAFGPAVGMAGGALAARELTKGLKRADRDPHLYVLALFPDVPKEVLERALSLLMDPTGEVRAAALEFLATRRRLIAGSWARVVRLLHDETPRVREASVHLLSMVVELPPAVLELVGRLEADLDPHVARAVADFADRRTLLSQGDLDLALSPPRAPRPRAPARAHPAASAPWSCPPREVSELLHWLSAPSPHARAAAAAALRAMPDCPHLQE